MKNLGNAEAKKIQIKINGDISSSRVEKFSEADAVQTFNQNRIFEIVYPELPAQGGFRLVFKSTGDGVKVSDLVVSHSAGTAQEAFSSKDTSIGVYSIILMGVYLLLIAFFIKQIATSSHESTLRYESVARILQTRRPWHISEGKWRSMIEAGLDYQIAKDHFYGRRVRESESYRLLESDKPSSLDGAAWEKILSKANDSMHKGFSAAIDTLSAGQLLEVIREERPRRFPEDKWRDLQEKATDRYFAARSRNAFNAKDFLRELSDRKPDGVLDKHWSDYVDSLRRKYRYEISLDLEVQANPIEYLSEQDLTVLSVGDREYLKNVSYRLQMRKLPDLSRPENAKRFLDSPRPEWLSDGDQKMLSLDAEEALSLERERKRLDSLDRSLKEKVAENTAESSRLANEKEGTALLKEKVEKQLSTIHSLLCDSSTLDRLEDYDNSFATGNFENLKRIAKILADAKDDGRVVE